MDKKLLDIVSEIQEFRKRSADQRFAPFHKFIRDVIAPLVDISFRELSLIKHDILQRYKHRFNLINIPGLTFKADHMSTITAGHGFDSQLTYQNCFCSVHR